jgi:Flp pilus assembly protein TadG
MNGRIGLRNGKTSLIADQRGAVAFEMPIVFALMIFSLIFPLADVAISGFQFISAAQALRSFGQSIQYSPPSDVTNTSSWSTAAVAKADPSYPIPTINVICGTKACSSSNTASPMYYSYSTTVTLAPMVLKSILCTSTNANPCTFNLSYSERFQ